jgi:carbon monoxide dehydrogenase subunit G
MQFQVESNIDRPPEAVFDRMADARNEPSWNSQVASSELVSGEPIEQGTRFVTYNRGQRYDATLTTYRRPEQLVFEVTGKRLDITASFTISGVGEGGSHVVSQFDFRPKGMLKAMFPAMKGAIRKDLAKQSASFKQFCEG